jgi:thiol-disulfide isomerase/thioredoxin
VEISCYNNTIEWEKNALAKVMVDANGRFSATFPWAVAGQAELQVADQYTRLFLTPGDSIQLACDHARFDTTIHYTGRGALENNFLAADMLAGYLNMAYDGTAVIGDARSFALFVDSLEQLNLALFRRLEDPAWSVDFRRHVTTDFKYRFIDPRWMYSLGYDQVKNEFIRKDLPAGYFDFLDELDLDDETAYDHGTYSTALGRYISEDPAAKVDVPDSLTPDAKVEMWVRASYAYRKALFKGRVRDHQLTAFVKDQLEQCSDRPALLEWLVNDHKATCTTPGYVALIDRLYTDAARMMPGQPAPGFALSDTSGASVSLADLTGNVVFLDLWATWCAPCLVAMPRVSELEEQFKDRKDVVFVKVNVNDDLKRWKDFVAKRSLTGMNLFADEERSAELRKAYNFNGIPHFVLIGKDGRLIDANAGPDERTGVKIRAALGD